MRYADLLDRIKASTVAVDAARAELRRSDFYKEYSAVRAEGVRVYVLDHDAERGDTTLEVWMDASGPTTFLTSQKRSLYYDVSAALLTKAAAAVAMVEQWVRGEIDDLPPSGPWPPAPGGEVASAVPNESPLDAFTFVEPKP